MSDLISENANHPLTRLTVKMNPRSAFSCVHARRTRRQNGRSVEDYPRWTFGADHFAIVTKFRSLANLYRFIVRRMIAQAFPATLHRDKRKPQASPFLPMDASAARTIVSANRGILRVLFGGEDAEISASIIQGIAVPVIAVPVAGSTKYESVHRHLVSCANGVAPCGETPQPLIKPVEIGSTYDSEFAARESDKTVRGICHAL